jgi:hypothetical protein
MAALEEHEDFMGEFLSKKGNTIEDLADVLQATYPEQRGFSSIEVSNAFLKKKGLNRGIVSNEQLNDAVRVAVFEVVVTIYI